ncbi:hypothetical protein MKZ02_21060 [Pseudobacillus sp. FSL P4-0506]|uniref:hypothetical protein n=1 Tax=Pseudobacillus sp. FSL P4-0506 TaxID=2921576 RepID=UPI0030FA002E
MSNELWQIETGWLCGYTEDRDLMRRIKRYKKGWCITADYFRNDRHIGSQYKIPIEQRRPAERMFGVVVIRENKAI